MAHSRGTVFVVTLLSLHLGVRANNGASGGTQRAGVHARGGGGGCGFTGEMVRAFGRISGVGQTCSRGTVGMVTGVSGILALGADHCASTGAKVGGIGGRGGRSRRPAGLHGRIDDRIHGRGAHDLDGTGDLAFTLRRIAWVRRAHP